MNLEKKLSGGKVKKGDRDHRKNLIDALKGGKVVGGGGIIGEN